MYNIHNINFVKGALWKLSMSVDNVKTFQVETNLLFP